MDLRRVLKELRPHFSLSSSSLAGTGPSCSVEWRKKLHSLYISGSSVDRDDLIFIVRWLHSEKKEEVDVFRKHSSSLPGPDDPDILWDQSFYLNLLMHEFEYHVTCSAITMIEERACIDKSLMAVSQRVYPTTSKQRMDKRKGHCEMAYPNIIFSLDNFQEVFSELHVSCPGEKISFQLQAVNMDCKIKQTIFLGAIDYQILDRVYKQRAKEESSLMFKMKHFSRILKSSGHTDHSLPTRYYIKINGPNSKGCAEVALYKKDIDSQDIAASGGSETKSSSDRGSLERDWVEVQDSTTEAIENACGHLPGNGIWEDAGLECRGEGDIEGSNHQVQCSVPPQTMLDLAAQSNKNNGNHGGEKRSFASHSAAESEVSSHSATAAKMSTFPLIYANLTYIELSWHSILQDILEHE